MLEWEEFNQLVLNVFRVNKVDDVPKSRMKFFWNELDRDHNNVIDFKEFARDFFYYFYFFQVLSHFLDLYFSLIFVRF